MNSIDQATRCPACKTVFRVVADQLRVSEGWVRCGRCANVFNASEHMMDMDGGWARLSESVFAGGSASGSAGASEGAPVQEPTQAPVHGPESWPEIPPPDAPVDPPPAPRDVAPAESWRLPRTTAHRARQDGHDNERLASKIEAAMSRSQLQQRPPVQPPLASSLPLAAEAAPAPVSGLTFRRPAATPGFNRPPVDPPTRPQAPWEPAAADDGPAAPQVAPAPAPPFAPLFEPPEPSHFDETRPESAWPHTVVAQGLDDLRADPKPVSAQNTAAPSRSPLPSAKPGFMRKAERDQLWRRPHMRALLVGALAGSALLLAAQVTLAYRDMVAARYPATKPVLDSLCAGLGCTVQAARSIDSLAVESSGLVRVDKTPLYKLQVTLRNRATLELALPALDVTFTDSKGDVISRKVLLPQDLSSTIDRQPGPAGGTVPAGREVTLQGTLQTSGAAPESVAGYTVELFYP